MIVTVLSMGNSLKFSQTPKQLQRKSFCAPRFLAFRANREMYGQVSAKPCIYSECWKINNKEPCFFTETNCETELTDFNELKVSK